MTTGSRTEGLRGIGAEGFIRTVKNLTVTGDLVVHGETRSTIGTGSAFWETADANANYWAYELPSGGSINVPVVGFGIGLDDVDLGLFDGITQTTVAVLDADRDSFVAIDFSADDAARIRSNTTINITPTGALSVGTDGSGNNVVFYSATSGDNLTWDSGDEVLQITGTNGQTSLDVLDGDVRIVDTLYFYDRGGESISSDGSTLTIAGTVVFSGNMTVNGTTTTVTSSTVVIDDPLFHLGNDNNADAVDLGIFGEYTDSGKKFTGLFRDASDSDKWKLFATSGNSHEEPSTTVNTTSGFTLANLAVNELDGTLTTASQTNITAVGTITTGTWQGTTIAVDQGGTGATTLNNLITLTTHTTGNYVATVTAGTGLTSTGATSGEGIAHSLSVDAAQTGITSVGALDGGSITSGFGTIDTGASTITTTGLISGGSLDIDNVLINGTTIGHTDDTDLLTVADGLLTLTGKLILDGNRSLTPGDGGAIHLDTHTVTDSNTSGSGTATKYTHVNIEAPTLAATNSSVTTTDAATLYVSGAVAAGTNETLTRTWAVWVDAGNVRYDGSIYAGTTEALNSSGLVTVANQSNITGVGTITSGTWEGTTLAVDQGGTGATSLNNLITLTTHTTGNYVATITGGTGIDSNAATSGEGTTHTLSVDLAEVGDVAIADGDYIAFMDATDSNATKKEALADVATLFAGAGLTAASSVLAVGAGELIDVASDAVAVDLTEATEAAIADGDYILFLDGGTTGTHAKENIADVATLFAGTGLTAASSVINVDAAQSGITSLGTLTGLTLDGNKSVTPGDGSMIHLDTSTITDSNTSGSGTAALYTHVRLEAPTLAATNSSVTTTNAATLYINAAATAGTNQTITNNYALLVDAGNSRFDGEVQTATIAYTDGDNAMTIADGGGVTFPVSIDVTGSVGIILENDETITNSTNGEVAINGTVVIGTGSGAGTLKSSGNQDITIATGNSTTGSITIVDGANGDISISPNGSGDINIPADVGIVFGDDGEKIEGDGTDLIIEGNNIKLTPSAAVIQPSGHYFLNDTANGNVTTGITINQGAADNQIFALKSSDQAHNMTGVAEADTFGAFSKRVSTQGGLHIEGFTDSERGINLTAYVDSVATTANAGGEAAVVVRVAEHDGSNGLTNPSANACLFAVGIWDGSSLGLKFIVDEDGDIFYDGAAAAYDQYDDAALARAFDLVVSPDKVIKNRWDDFVQYNEKTLVDTGILGDSLKNRGLINATQLQRLHNGAISQMREDMINLVNVLSPEQHARLPESTRGRLALGEI